MSRNPRPKTRRHFEIVAERLEAKIDRRLRTLEDVVADLQSRVERLESATHDN
jgi:hypothetical protein